MKADSLRLPFRKETNRSKKFANETEKISAKVRIPKNICNTPYKAINKANNKNKTKMVSIKSLDVLRSFYS